MEIATGFVQNSHRVTRSEMVQDESRKSKIRFSLEATDCSYRPEKREEIRPGRKKLRRASEVLGSCRMEGLNLRCN